MIPVQTSFPEIYFDTPEEARAARDEQAAQLEAKGIRCRRETLYRATDGRCVFVITIDDDEIDTDVKSATPSKPQPRHSRPQKRREKLGQVEYR